VRNVARLSLEETMTESSDVAADYSSDGSDDRWVVAAFLGSLYQFHPFCSIVQLRRQFNLAMNRANEPSGSDQSSNARNAHRSHAFAHQHPPENWRSQDDDSSSYDSLNHIAVEEHISSVSQASRHETSPSNARAASHRSPRHVITSDDDEDVDSNHYRDLLHSITSKMRENRLGGGGMEPFEIDHTSAPPVPSAASFTPYPAPISRTHTRVGEGSSGQAAMLHKSSKASAAAVAAAASAAHNAYAHPFPASGGAENLRPFDVSAVEERMKLMRQSYLDQVRAIAGAQAKAFTITAPNSMSARRMSQLATPGGQLRSIKGWLLYAPFSSHSRPYDCLSSPLLHRFSVTKHADTLVRIIYCT